MYTCNLSWRKTHIRSIIWASGEMLSNLIKFRIVSERNRNLRGEMWRGCSLSEAEKLGIRLYRNINLCRLVWAFFSKCAAPAWSLAKTPAMKKIGVAKIVKKCVLSILDVRRNWSPITQKQLVSFEVECRYVYCGQGVFAFEDKMERSRWRCSSYSQIGIALRSILINQYNINKGRVPDEDECVFFLGRCVDVCVWWYACLFETDVWTISKYEKKFIAIHRSYSH